MHPIDCGAFTPREFPLVTKIHMVDAPYSWVTTQMRMSEVLRRIKDAKSKDGNGFIEIEGFEGTKRYNLSAAQIVTVEEYEQTPPKPVVKDELPRRWRLFG